MKRSHDLKIKEKIKEHSLTFARLSWRSTQSTKNIHLKCLKYMIYTKSHVHDSIIYYYIELFWSLRRSFLYFTNVIINLWYFSYLYAWILMPSSQSKDITIPIKYHIYFSHQWMNYLTCMIFERTDRKNEENLKYTSMEG